MERWVQMDLASHHNSLLFWRVSAQTDLKHRRLQIFPKKAFLLLVVVFCSFLRRDWTRKGFAVQRRCFLFDQKEFLFVLQEQSFHFFQELNHQRYLQMDYEIPILSRL